MQGGDFFDVTYGSVRLWCSEITTDNSRTQVIHEVAEGDEHPTQDRGRAPGRPVTCELLWIEMPSERVGAQERFLRFKALVDAGDGPLLFVHPLDGAYYASVSDFKYTIDEDENISSCSVTFIRSAPAESPIPAGAGTSLRAGEDLVAARAAALNTELLNAGLEDSSIGDDAISAQESWAASDTIPTRQVIVDVAGLSSSIESLIVDERLEDDLALFGAFKATIMMGDAVRAAALAALAETPKVTSILIRQPISLLALCVRLYGGALAEDRVRQVLALNDLRYPGWIPEGALVIVPVPPRPRRNR